MSPAEPPTSASGASDTPDAPDTPDASDASGGPDTESLVDAFWSVAGHLRHLSRNTALPFGITPGQARALGMLQRHGGMRLSDLAEHLRIAPRSTTEVIDALELLELVGRAPDPGDRRATLVNLTDHGGRVSGALHQARGKATETFFGRLSSEDRQTLTRILRSLRS